MGVGRPQCDATSAGWARHMRRITRDLDQAHALSTLPHRSSRRCKKRPQPFNWDALPPRSPDDTMPAGNACELPSGSLTDTTTRGVMLHNARPHRAIHHEMLRAMLAWRGRASATLCHPLSDNLLARNGPAPCCGRTPVRSAGCLATLFSCYPIADTTRADY
jgi:hypothetical protein